MTVISNQEDMDTALDLAVGQVATVKGFSLRALASKLLAMGVLPGSRIELIRKAPFGKTYYIAIDDHYIALRQRELQAIHIQK